MLDQDSLASLLADCSDEDAIHFLTHITSIEEFPGYMVRYFDEGALINHSARPSPGRAAFLSARNDVLANAGIIVSAVVTSITAGARPDPIAGLAIFLINLDAAHEVYGAAKKQRARH